MNKIEELLRCYCPDGVQFKRFDEVCSLHARIGWQRLTKAEYRETGEYMLITGTDFTDSNSINYDSCVYVSEERYTQDPHIQLKNGDILVTKDGTLGKVAQINHLPMPATLNGGVFVVRCTDGSLTSRFIMYYLLSNHFQSNVEKKKTGSTISHLTQGLFSRLLIPVPPIKVQEEIVCILDSFTALTSALISALTSELTARKKQYEFYRDKLFSFDNLNPEEREGCGVRWAELSTFAEIGTGSSNTDEGLSEGQYPFFVRSQEVRFKNEYEFDETAIITSGDGVGVGKIYHFIEGKYALHQRAYRIHIVDESIDPRYIYHFFRTKFYDHISANSFHSSVTSIRKPMLQKFSIPIPPLETQHEIVKKLDKFDDFIESLQHGLTAEIEVRRKQYEYYRDKLLSLEGD